MVLFILFILGVIALALLRADATKLFARAEYQSASYFLKEPADKDYICASPFYIVAGEHKGAEGYSYKVNLKTFRQLIAALDARLVHSENVVNFKVVYYFSAALPPSNIAAANGTAFNIQAAIYGNSAIIGFPLILGSY